MFKLCPQDIGIILSYRCPNGCQHCLYNCGPAWEQAPIAPAHLRAALEALDIWPRRPQVHFSGGEPFLYFDLLLQGVQWAAELNIPRYAETSASWCTSLAVGRQRFQAMHQAGLQAILISCSPFHAERIPLRRTLHAIQAALDVFGVEHVLVYQSKFIELIQQFDLDRPVPLARYEQALSRETVYRQLWQGYGLSAGGRAGYALGHWGPLQPAASFQDENCSWELLYAEHSHFDLYGNFMPGFCGGLSVGDWHSLPRILDDFQAERYPPLIHLLITHGPYGLYKMAQEKYNYQALPTAYAGKCHLCIDVRRHLATFGRFAELQPPHFYTAGTGYPAR